MPLIQIMVVLAKPILTCLYKHMQFSVIILAAGQGKRLKSAIPKPLHHLCGRPLLGWVTKAAHKAGAIATFIVTAADNAAFTPHIPQDARVFIQELPQGTGHAVASCLDALTELAPDHPVIILYADTPLIQSETIAKLAREVASQADICSLAFRAENPSGYGRMIIDGPHLKAIIEERDASPEQREITFVNGGVMAAKAKILCQLLPRLEKANAQGEYYLTDLIMLANQQGIKTGYLEVEASEVAGVNDRQQLAELEAVMQMRLRERAMQEGVSLVDPVTVYLSADTQFGRDVVIEPHVVIGPNSHIGDGCCIKSFSHIEGAEIEAGCIIGPHARLRPGTHLEQGVKIGNFVETKNAHFEAGAKANHLSYLGDAHIGSHANIGAGTITCNYDGFNKAKTEIGAYAFIGSNSALVAPVQIEEYALIGAGSVITQKVESHALSLSRTEQKTYPTGAKRFRARAQKLKDQKGKDQKLKDRQKT